jgi:nicotinamide riboside transporter PnuC
VRVVGGLQQLIYVVFLVVIFGLAVWALVDAARRPEAAFVSAGKQSKKLWLVILVAATVLSFLTCPPLFLLPPFPALLSAVAAIVYLVDVKPAIAPYTRRRGPGGPRGSSGGGW